MRKVLTCVGTRPNFIKITQLERCFKKYSDIEYKLLHTGQHFDENMSKIFFDELKIKKPDIFLNAKGETSSEMISSIITKMEEFLTTYRPDIVMVPGDVNSSYACAYAANKLNIPVAHIESGLRSFDNTMPEELNRIKIDDIAELLFVTEPSGIANLHNEGKVKNKIHFVGNTMIDTLIAYRQNIEKSDILNKINRHNKPLAAITFHRPANVDNPANLEKITDLLIQLSGIYTIVYPIHPRTRKNLNKFNLEDKISGNENIILLEPLGYLDFMKLVKESAVIITDSGGIQEETTFIGIPCITVRPNTERPVTITEGTNTLIDLEIKLIMNEVDKIAKGKYKTGKIPELWDGKSSERIVDIISEYFKQK